MEAFSLIPSISVAVKAPNFSCVKLSARTKRSMVCCQTGSHAIKSTGISTVLTETSSLVSQENGSVVMENGSLVLTPNGKEEGIGIVKFLRGKTFLITGATGFLGKGTVFSYPFSIPRRGSSSCLTPSIASRMYFSSH